MTLPTSLRLLFAFALYLFVSVAIRAQDAAPKPTSADASLQLPATDDGLPGAGPINRKDWFAGAWKTKRTGWAARAAEDQNALVFLGDSITQGWKDDFQGKFPGVKLANRGISGDTSRGVLIRLLQDVLSLNPRGIVLLIGTNDLGFGTDPETIAGNLKLILAAVKKHDPKMPVILCKVFPAGDGPNRSALRIQALNRVYLEAVKNDPQVTVLDTWTLFAGPDGNAKKEEFPDLLHPNEIGYDKWASALRPLLVKLGLMETTVKKIVPESTSTTQSNAGFPLPPTDEGLPGEGVLRRGEWFQGVWTKRRSTFAQRREQDRGAIVFVGDSITDSWGDDLGGSFPGLKVANRGVNADTTRGALIRLQEDVLSLNPRAVVLLIGTNDLAEGMAPEMVVRNLKLIIAAIKEHNPQTPIILCTLFPNVKVKELGGADKVQALNKLYVESLQDDSNITVIDTWKLFADANGDAMRDEFPDGRHPNQLGYAKWAAALQPILAKLD